MTADQTLFVSGEGFVGSASGGLQQKLVRRWMDSSSQETFTCHGQKEVFIKHANNLDLLFLPIYNWICLSENVRFFAPCTHEADSFVFPSHTRPWMNLTLDAPLRRFRFRTSSMSNPEHASFTAGIQVRFP